MSNNCEVLWPGKSVSYFDVISTCRHVQLGRGVASTTCSVWMPKAPIFLAVIRYTPHTSYVNHLHLKLKWFDTDYWTLSWHIIKIMANRLPLMHNVHNFSLLGISKASQRFSGSKLIKLTQQCHSRGAWKCSICCKATNSKCSNICVWKDVPLQLPECPGTQRY